MKVLYEDFEYVYLDMPYIPGFLAFREAPHLIKLFQRMKASKPEYYPQVVLVDGNGILHPNGCGLASHLGVLLNLPMIGCGKTVFYIDGLSKDKVHKLCDEKLHKGGDSVKLVGDSGKVWGAGFRSKNDTKDPLIISHGHMISLDTAIKVVANCCKFRIPEPIRLADTKSRDKIRKMTS